MNTELNIPESGTLDYIYQISDIHIRSGDESSSRFKEYEIVFNNLYSILSKLQPIIDKKAAIVITGDTFHHKCKIESPGIKLFHMMIKQLSSLAPVYIILGNHDFKQDGTINIDFLEAFLYGNIKNINYLDKTGLYVSCGVGFGIVSVKDTLDIGSGSGIISSLPQFPIPCFDSSITTKIALFHGTMTSSKFNDNRFATNGYPWDWIDIGYDIAMLGDIHKFQSFKRKSGLIAAYSGSLIQQNFGESLQNHGILEWNINKRSFTHIEIPNNYGFLKLHLKYCPDDSHFWSCDNENIVDKIEKWTHFPQNIKVRLFGNHTQKQRFEIDMYLTNNIDKHEIDDFFVLENDTNISDKTFEINNNNFTSVEKVSEFMKAHDILDYSEPKTENLFITLPELGNEICSICTKKNKEIEKEVQKYNNLLDNFEPTRIIKFSFLEWFGLLCYSDLNWFNFNDTYKRTNLISGKNGSGKSSFLELINIAIFGKSIPSRKTKGNSSTIIAIGKKNKDVPSFTKIDIVIATTLFRINRFFDNDGKPKNRCGGVFKYDKDNGKWIKLFSENSKINVWVATYLGSQDTFLTTTLLSQNNDNDILNMSRKEQREHLEKIIGLDKITAEVNLYKCVLNSNKYIASNIRSSLETAKDVSKIQDTNDYIEKLDLLEKHKTLINQLREKHSQIPTITHIYDEFRDVNIIQNEISQIVLDKDSDEIKNSLILTKLLLENKKFDIIRNKSFDFNECSDHKYKNKPKKPTFSKEFCISKMKECENWNNDELKNTLESDYVIPSDLIIKLNNFVKQKDELFPPCQKPVVSLLQLESDRLHNSSKLQELQSLIGDTKIHVYQEPDISLENIMNIKREVELEIETNGPNPGNKEFENAKTNIIKYETSFSQLLKESDTLKDNIQINESQYEYLNSNYLSFRNEIQNITLIPHKDKYLLKRKLHTIKKNKHLFFIKSSLCDYIKIKIKECDLIKKESKSNYKIMQTLQQSISSIKHTVDELPFNPDCVACQQQPLRMQVNKLQMDLNHREALSHKYKNKMHDILNGINYELLVTIHDKFVKFVKYFRHLLDNESEFETTYYNSTLDELKFDHYYAQEAIINCLRRNNNYMRKKLNSISDNINDANVQLNKNRQIVLKYNYCHNNKERWNEKMNFVNDYIKLWDTYEKNKKYNEIIENIYTIQDTIDKLDANITLAKEYDLYISNRDYLNENIKQIEIDITTHETYYANKAAYSAMYIQFNTYTRIWDQIELIEETENRKEYFELTTKLQYYEEYLDKCIKHKNLVQLLQDVNNYKCKKTLETSISNLNAIIIDLEVELKVSHTLQIHNKETLKKYNTLLLSNEIISKNITYCEKIILFLDLFRKDTLQIVIPVLEKHANELLHIVDNKLQISCDINDDGLFKFELNNGHFMISLEKTSGFERSMISICLRLAFIILNQKNGFTSGQLLIDEAFANCDSSHIKKIPNYLNSLLVFFDSIILVSHIEHIKDSVDNIIPISNFSIKFGEKECN